MTAGGRRRWWIGVSAVLVGLSGYAAAGAPPSSFPHLRHEGLFPVCQGCHLGVETDAEEAFYPEPARCAACHDGVREDPVQWAGPSIPPRHVVFSHASHVRAVAGEGEAAPGCAACHGGDGDRMDVAAASPQACLGCHAHEAPEHLAPGRDCSTCHGPLSRSDVTPARIAAFPRPASHDAEGFLVAHAPPAGEASCAVCHARESCARCHLNADALPAVRALEPDPRVAALVAGRAPSYPVPTSHGDPAWSWAHGGAASSEDASCASCHARPDCRACHVEADPAGAARLAVPPPGDPRGVRLGDRENRVHDPGWVRAHPAAAAVAEQTCAGCHAPTFCVGCHEGPDAPSFHLPNFMEMHGPEAYGRETECVACHNPQVFCRSCHVDVGLASSGERDVAFHTSRPFWLLGHGAAARQGLEGCVTCHSQNDCVACHSVFSGWGVDPHGPGFDAERARAANPAACAPCHLGGVPP